MAHSNTALVLGATGGIGSEVARQLRQAGWNVRALKRGAPQAEAQRDGITWVRGDALNRDDVMAAARGCSVIVHAVNPPGYRRWAELVLPMLDNTIAAAQREGATIVLPGTVYNYGPDAFPLLREDSPQNPLTRKGAIRVALERRLEAATASGCRAIVVRAGDFFGPKLGNSWFAQGMIRPGQPVKSVALPAERGVGHQWAYLPDVAETIVALVEREHALQAFDSFHMGGHWDADGRAMQDAIRRASGQPGLRVRRFPWWLLTLASPVVPVFRELREMRYLWQQPVRLRNARLLALLGSEPHTPLDAAVVATLQGLGCLRTAGGGAALAGGG